MFLQFLNDLFFGVHGQVNMAVFGVDDALVALGGAASIGSGLATIFGGSPSQPTGRLKLDSLSLEDQLLQQFADYMSQAKTGIEADQKLTGLIEQRVNALRDIVSATQPSPDSLARLQAANDQILKDYGNDVLADVNAGIISNRTKQQALQLQDSIEKELQATGKDTTDQSRADIQNMIRQRLSGSSLEEQTLQGVQKLIIDEIGRQGGQTAPPQDPNIERQIKDQEQSLRSNLRSQFGPNFESTTAGRRALNDFYQKSSELRYSTGAQRISNLANLTNTALGSVQARDTGIASSIQNVSNLEQAGIQRANRISALGQAITVPAQSYIAGNLPRQSQIDFLGKTLGGAAQTATANEAALSNLSLLPSQLRDKILKTQGDRFNLFERLGNFDLTGGTKQAIEGGALNAPAYGNIPGKLQSVGGYFTPEQNAARINARSIDLTRSFRPRNESSFTIGSWGA